jgi:hypothetical protein
MFCYFYTRHMASGDIGLRCVHSNGVVEYCYLNNFKAWSISCLTRDTIEDAIKAMRHYDYINGYPEAELVCTIGEPNGD